MQIFRRCFSASRNFQNAGPSLREVYTKLFRQPCFDSIRDKIPSLNDTPDPYIVSQKLGEIINSSHITPSQAALISNKLIQELSQFDYSVASTQCKNLTRIGHNLTVESIRELIKHNPGRVHSSWELYIRYLKAFKILPDEILIETLKKVAFFDTADRADGKKTLEVGELVQALHLMDKIESKVLIPKEIVTILLVNAIQLKSPELLNEVLRYEPSLSIIEEHVNELTLSGLYSVYKAYPIDVIGNNKNTLYKIFEALGENETIELTREEIERNEKFLEEVQRIRNLVTWDIHFKTSNELPPTKEDFGTVLEYLGENNLYKDDLRLSQLILRTVGVFKGDIKSELELFNIISPSFKRNEKDYLQFETFLSLAYQAFKNSNKTSLEFAEAFLTEVTTSEVQIDMLRTMIISNAKFNVDTSLNLYNEAIPKLSKKKDPESQIAPSDLVTEAIIMAFLYKKDLNFARVIFDGAVGEKVLTGVTAVKRIKKLLSEYGDALEKNELDNFMELHILRYLQNI